MLTGYSREDVLDGIKCIENQLDCGYVDIWYGDADGIEVAIVKAAIQEYKKNHNLVDTKPKEPIDI